MPLGDLLRNVWHLYTAVKKKALLPEQPEGPGVHSAECISQAEKDKCHTISLRCGV